MYKYILTFISITVIFLSINCNNNLKNRSTGEWEYINPRGKYIKADKLWAIIKDKDIHSFIIDSETRNYETLDENRGTMAGVGYDSANGLAFMVMIFDSNDNVERIQKANGFKIIERSDCLIYAESKRSKGGDNYYILMNNRIMLVFWGFDIDKNKMKDIVFNYDTSRIIELIK